MKELLRSHLPRPIWKSLSLGKCIVLDSLDTVSGRRDPLIPPRRKVFIGSGDFRTLGDEFLRHFRTLCDLQPNERVLDIGCGIGRMAVPLTSYLASGSYEGFDIVPSGIDWCAKNITPRFPNFSFQVADIHNKEYNPSGKYRASEYRFPYPDASFDFAFLTSVFTHMLPDEVANYLREIRRVLRPAGRVLATWLLLNDESERLIASGKSSLSTVHPIGPCKTSNRKVPEEAIAYPETLMHEMVHASGLTLSGTNFGNWCGRSQFTSTQDITVLRMPHTSGR